MKLRSYEVNLTSDRQKSRFIGFGCPSCKSAEFCSNNFLIPVLLVFSHVRTMLRSAHHRRPMKGCGLIISLNILLVICFCGPARCNEILVKIANVDHLIVNRYTVLQEQSFFSKHRDFCDPLLGQALAAGIIPRQDNPREKGHIYQSHILAKPIRPALETAEHLPLKGRMTGRQLAQDRSGWNKFIIEFDGDSTAGGAVFEINGGPVPLQNRISHVVVQNRNAELENWHVRDRGFGRPPPRTVWRVSETLFQERWVEKKDVAWFNDMVIMRNGIGVLIVVSDDGQGLIETGDRVLLLISSQDLPPYKSGMPRTAVILGWQR